MTSNETAKAEIISEFVEMVGSTFGSLHSQTKAVFQALRDKSGISAAIFSGECLICIFLSILGIGMLLFSRKYKKIFSPFITYSIMCALLLPYRSQLYKLFSRFKSTSTSPGFFDKILNGILSSEEMVVLIIALIFTVTLTILITWYFNYICCAILSYYTCTYTFAYLQPQTIIHKLLLFLIVCIFWLVCLYMFAPVIKVAIVVLYTILGALMLLTISAIFFGFPSQFKDASADSSHFMKLNIVLSWFSVTLAGLAFQYLYLGKSSKAATQQ